MPSGGGVDGAIYRAARPELLAECHTLHGCATGNAKITKGYRLTAGHVIHAVGPVWHGGRDGQDALLALCYRRAIEPAQDDGLGSIAFQAICTGVYRFRRPRRTGRGFRDRAGTGCGTAVTRVIFCCFSDASASLHVQALAGVGSPCTD